jgi:Flp pilus assembly protein TadG
MTYKFKHRQRCAQTGAVLAEFAILIPFLLLLLAGIVEIGYTYFHLNVLNKSVQDAARYFSDPTRARNGVFADPITISSNANITPTQNLVIYGITAANGNPLLPNGAAMTVTVSCLQDSTGTPSTTTCPIATHHHIRVTANYIHPYLFSDLLRNLCGGCIPPTNYPLTASAVFRVEGGN